MPALVLGTAGHIDHGKTALVRALTGQDTDRLPEEKRRGITIDLGFARLDLPGYQYAVVDVPGHESLVRNMLAGATGIDVVLLVVAADEGVMPQTREHLAIMELLAVRDAVVAITKMDLVEAEWLELVCEEVRGELASTRFADAALVPVSAVTGAGLPQLRQELVAAAARSPARTAEDLFRLPIDRVFTVRGTGTVVTGTVWSGRVQNDSTVRLLPQGTPVRVRALQRHGMPAAAAAAGERIALALAAPRDSLQRGDTLVDHPGWRPGSNLTVQLSLLPDAPPLRPRQRVRLNLGTAEVLARCAAFGAEPLAPGTHAWAQLRLETPVVARAGDRFVIRSYSPVHTVGGGVVAEPAAVRRKHLDAATIALLARVIGPGDRITPAALLGGRRGAPIVELPVLTGLPPRLLVAPLPDDVRLAGDVLYPAAMARELEGRFLAAVIEYHGAHPLEPGITREELRRAAAEAPPGLVDHVLGSMVAAARLVTAGTTVALPDYRPAPSPRQLRLADQLLELLLAAGPAPPRLAELPPQLRDDPELAAVARHLVREGRVVALSHDLLAHPAALQDATRALAASFSEHPRQSASRLKEVLGVTRKHLIPLLEYFDRVDVTRRDGEDRVAGAGLRSTSGEGG